MLFIIIVSVSGRACTILKMLYLTSRFPEGVGRGGKVGFGLVFGNPKFGSLRPGELEAIGKRN